MTGSDVQDNIPPALDNEGRDLRVSCTVSLTSTYGWPSPTPSYYVFHNVSVGATCIAQRFGISSLLLGSLLFALRTRLLLENEHAIPNAIIDLIEGRSPAQCIDVATTRVPSFSDITPHAGYRILGRLNAIDVQMKSPPTDMMDPWELLALEDHHPASAEYCRIWRAFGIEAQTHFMVLFKFHSPEPSSPISPYSPHLSLHRNSVLFAPGRRSSEIVTPPRLPDVMSHASHGPPVVDLSLPPSLPPPNTMSHVHGSSVGSSALLPPSIFHVSRESSPLSSLASSGSHLSVMDGVPVAAQDTQREIGRQLTVENFCQHFGISAGMGAAARYNDKDKSLVTMVLNHRAIKHILERLGFCGENTLNKARTVVFGGHQELSLETILRMFEWTFKTYEHKVKWYSWAESAAKSYEWDETRAGSDQHTVAREIWLGIKYFWGPSGPLQSGGWLEQTQMSPGEEAARRLSQTQVDKNRILITQYLAPRPASGLGVSTPPSPLGSFS